VVRIKTHNKYTITQRLHHVSQCRQTLSAPKSHRCLIGTRTYSGRWVGWGAPPSSTTPGDSLLCCVMPFPCCLVWCCVLPLLHTLPLNAPRSEIVKYVLPSPNRVVIFDAKIPHMVIHTHVSPSTPPCLAPHFALLSAMMKSTTAIGNSHHSSRQPFQGRHQPRRAVRTSAHKRPRDYTIIIMRAHATDTIRVTCRYSMAHKYRCRPNADVSLLTLVILFTLQSDIIPIYL
jgi:hypothetical protein